MGVRLRRLIPPLVVGTTSVAGTGGLIAWVSDQAGMQSASTTMTTHPVRTTVPVVASKSVASTRDTQALAAVQKQLSAEETTLQALQGKVAALGAQARSKTTAAAGQGNTNWASNPSGVRSAGTSGAGLAPATGGSGTTPSAGAMTPLPALTPLPTLPTITVRAPAPVAAPPPANATTGASHAVP